MLGVSSGGGNSVVLPRRTFELYSFWVVMELQMKWSCSGPRVVISRWKCLDDYVDSCTDNILIFRIRNSIRTGCLQTCQDRLSNSVQ